MIKKTYFSGIRFDHYQLEELLDLLIYTDKTRIVVTPNIDHVVRANENKSLLELYRCADISVNDSRVLKKLTRLINVDVGSVIPGSDLTKRIIQRSSELDIAIAIIGSSEASVGRIREKYSLKNVSHYNPPMGFIDSKEEVKKCIDFILQNPSKFIFLAVGSPRQEILAKTAKAAGASGVFLCIGASLQFLSGDEVRAPKIFQKLSLEWLFRLLQSPRRLAGRYFHDFIEIIPLLIKEKRSRDATAKSSSLL